MFSNWFRRKSVDDILYPAVLDKSREEQLDEDFYKGAEYSADWPRTLRGHIQKLYSLHTKKDQRIRILEESLRQAGIPVLTEDEYFAIAKENAVQTDRREYYIGGFEDPGVREARRKLGLPETPKKLARVSG